MAIQLKTGYAMTLVLVALTGGGASALAAPISSPTAGAAARLPATPVAQAGPVHPTQALPVALRPVFYRALAKDADAAYAINKDGCAALPKQPLKACFDGTGAHFTLPAGQAGGTTPASPAGRPLSLHLAAWGRGDTLASAAVVRPTINANQARYVHGNLTEWWRVLPIGFEQGFTIAKRPTGNGELTLALTASRQDACLCVSARRQAGALTIRHSRAGGNPVEKGIPTGGQDTNAYWIPAFAGMTKKKNGNTLAWGKLRYGDLVVMDAKGKVVPATLTTIGNQVRIAVNDAHAAYPLTVDPLVWLEQEVTASDGAAGDNFGVSVALAGTTALIGAIGNNSFQGAVYVFDESNSTWIQTQELTASDGVTGDHFGWSVALAGTTALVGARNRNNYQGAAYVFSEAGGTWSQTVELSASNAAETDVFGSSVALSGTTALVGADGYNGAQGTAYFEGESDLGLAVNAPQTVNQGQQYVSQTLATNSGTASSPAVSATMTIPAAASFISATATQGSCSEAAGVVTCDFGQIPANAGTATANITLKATGNVGDTINNTASIALATPPLTASAPTAITASCPAGYTSYTGVLAANAGVRAASYEAPGGQENALLYAPAGFGLYGRVDSTNHGQWKRRFSGTEVHRWGPAGTYAWGVKAGSAGGGYTLCILHP